MHTRSFVPPSPPRWRSASWWRQHSWLCSLLNHSLLRRPPLVLTRIPSPSASLYLVPITRNTSRSKRTAHGTTTISPKPEERTLGLSLRAHLRVPTRNLRRCSNSYFAAVLVPSKQSCPLSSRRPDLPSPADISFSLLVPPTLSVHIALPARVLHCTYHIEIESH